MKNEDCSNLTPSPSPKERGVVSEASPSTPLSERRGVGGEITFSKSERLCSRKLISQLYAEGHRIMAFPYSVQWRVSSELGVRNSELSECGSINSELKTPNSELCQVLIVAPKRRFHHAVDRNRVKRLTRECWRRVKPQLYDFLSAHGLSLTVALVYVGNEILPYDKLLSRMEKLVAQLEKELTGATQPPSNPAT